NYYYDFDMSETSEKSERKGFRPPSGRTVAIIALVALILLAVIFVLSFILADGQSDKNGEETMETSSESLENTVTYSRHEKTEVQREEDDYSSSDKICTAGAGAFILDENGRVVSLCGNVEEESQEETKNGASFTLNVTPYETDYNTWSDVAGLYNNPEGTMLFGVMENGTVAYDIFSSSKMNYEAAYKAVSSWRDVKELVWETGVMQNPCLFAIKKDGGLYVSDPEAEKSIFSLLGSFIENGAEIEQLSAKGGELYIIMHDGNFISIRYK
ncbi:MAG: hypothetical protein ACI4JN_02085, partial [Ruminococcus sp.]